jgi:hypothetical protein
MISEHIIELDKVGWMVTHPLRCPGNLLECEVTQLCREMASSPAIGRFWCYAEKRGNQVWLRIGDQIPPEIQGTSRRTGYHFVPNKIRPNQ